MFDRRAGRGDQRRRLESNVHFPGHERNTAGELGRENPSVFERFGLDARQVARDEQPALPVVSVASSDLLEQLELRAETVTVRVRQRLFLAHAEQVHVVDVLLELGVALSERAHEVFVELVRVGQAVVQPGDLRDALDDERDDRPRRIVERLQLFRRRVVRRVRQVARENPLARDERPRSRP